MIKRIYTFMLQTFLPIFCMTFAICLFIFMMQFLWRYVDEFVGKGLGLGVIAEMFFYAALQTCPMALPLAILLASLITFGNLGESLELLAMKASGISLLKIMRPLMIFIAIVSVGAFYFQNDVLPWANTKSYSLLIGIKNKSPELEIPEGVFYKMEVSSGDTYNIYVQDKDPKSGLLRDVTIYIFSGTNIEDATVTVADSARLQSTADGNHMKLTLWSGEQVGTFKANNRQRTDEKHPQYRRESFTVKEVFIPYSNDLERTDESLISSRHVGKNLEELIASVDSLDSRIDSINQVYSNQLVARTYFNNVREEKRQDTLFFAEVAKMKKSPVDLDSIYASLKPSQMVSVSKEAKRRSEAVVRSFDVRKEMQAIEYKNRSYHEIEIHKKFTLSIACLLFFFIGAPLGAIIRKGGLGVPVIVSVLFFIIYYVIDQTGYKSARDGAWSPWAGIWLSSMVLAPVGGFLTWRAINDSALFDWDAYKIIFVRLTKRAASFLKDHGLVSKTLYSQINKALHRHKPEEEASGASANPFRQQIKNRFRRQSIIILLALSSSLVPGMLDAAENLNRACVALKEGTKTIVEWRRLADDTELGTTFTLEIIDQSGATQSVEFRQESATCFVDENASQCYNLIVKDRKGKPIKKQSQYNIIPQDGGLTRLLLERPASNYTPNDMSVGDVDADGDFELIVKWTGREHDNSHNGVTDVLYFDCYEIIGKDAGTRLWRIDMGQNIRAGAHYNPFIVYDLDDDGKAEFVVKTAPGTRDAAGRFVTEAGASKDIRNCASNNSDFRNHNGHITEGEEFLTVFSGETGKALQTIWYNPNRGQETGKASQYGRWEAQAGKAANYNRGERYNACVAHLGGLDNRPSVIMQRGYYNFAYFWAVDWDGKNLSTRWLHRGEDSKSWKVTDASGKTIAEGSGMSSFGQGVHSISVADVDADEKDEIVMGSATIDHDGRLLTSTGFGHGDAIHLADLNPSREGLELYMPHEGRHAGYGDDMHDPLTGEILCRNYSGGDNGRGMAADFYYDIDPTTGRDKAYGYEFWSFATKGMINAVTGQSVSSVRPSMNFRLYWTGDVYDDLFDGRFRRSRNPSQKGGAMCNPTISTWNGSGITEIRLNEKYEGRWMSCNGTKSTPCLIADIWGDWREEIILWNQDNPAEIGIFTTTEPTEYQVTCLMQDHVYRMGIVWQNSSYNQPPHLGYYLPDVAKSSAMPQNKKQ